MGRTHRIWNSPAWHERYQCDSGLFSDNYDLWTEQLKLDGIVPGVILVWEMQAAIFSRVWGICKKDGGCGKNIRF